MTGSGSFMPDFMVSAAHSALVYLHGVLGSWGLSIIALTVIVRLVILPLTFKQVRGMQDMQRHAPELKKLQERFKDDPQRRNEETMKYYKEHQFNPLSSCLPLLLQIPVFITLFDVLKEGGPFSNDLGAGGDPGFLGIITDLAKPETGGVLVLLMALYVATQLGASLVSMVSAEKTQRRVMLALPFVFVSVVIYFPAGLVLYWITTNVWTVGQQLVVKRFLPPLTKDGDEEKGDGKAPATTSADGKGKGASGRSLTAGSSANGDNGGPQKAPPPSPRKKKKRSGRRR